MFMNVEVFKGKLFLGKRQQGKVHLCTKKSLTQHDDEIKIKQTQNGTHPLLRSQWIVRVQIIVNVMMSMMIKEVLPKKEEKQLNF